MAPDEPCIIGSGVMARRRALVARAGAPSLSAALLTLPADVRREYESVTPISWVRITTVESVGDAVAREAGLDPDLLHDLTTRDSVEHQFRTLWRVMLRFTSDEALVSRTSMMYSKTRNVGRLTSEIRAPGRAEIQLTGWPRPGERPVRSIAIGTETVLRLAGRCDVKMAWKLQRDGASFVATWSVR